MFIWTYLRVHILVLFRFQSSSQRRGLGLTGLGFTVIGGPLQMGDGGGDGGGSDAGRSVVFSQATGSSPRGVPQWLIRAAHSG